MNESVKMASSKAIRRSCRLLFAIFPVLYILLIHPPVPLTGEEGFSVNRVNERVMVLSRGHWDENMTAIDAGTNLVIVDTWSSPVAAEKARAFIEKTFHKPVRYVINTHHHFDHAFGNQAFKKDSIEIVGHRFCPEDMKAEYGDETLRANYFKEAIEKADKPEYKLFLNETVTDIVKDFHLTTPTHLVDDQETLKTGDITIRLYHVPGLHTRSNLTIYVPELGLVFTRRDFHKNSKPVFEENPDFNKMISSLEDILASGKPVKYIMPGHGKPLSDPDLNVALSYIKSIANQNKKPRK